MSGRVDIGDYVERAHDKKDCQLSFIVKTAKVRAARSCEYSATNAWNLNLNNGNANNNTKATNQNRVRAVSAPLQIASTLRR